MRPWDAPARLAVLIGLLALSASAWAAMPRKDAVERLKEILGDLSQPDDKRVDARNALLRHGAEGLDALVELGKNPGQAKEEDNDNIRTQVAIALADVRPDRPMPPAIEAVRKKAAQNVGLLLSWFERKDADPALRYWAIRAISFAQAPQSGEIVKKVLESDPDANVRLSLVRSLGAWEGDALTATAIPLLVEQLKSKNPKARLAGVEGLRLTGRTKRDVVLPLFAVARDDPDEAVWRDAAEAIRHITKLGKSPPPRVPTKERHDTFGLLEKDWLRAHPEEKEPAP
jgi:HEAT repeat protein